ncbi:hypothetical protein B0H19DRAFT_1269017 [Mycena capillaripes]|nr:hypothetical protein B0H19DRAFT_1269017 [Mycena capillaripes]
MPAATSLIAISVLENPRAMAKSGFIVFDAQIYLGSSEPALITSVRYFNSDNTVFEDVGCYCIAARTTPTIEVYSQNLTPVDCHAFGDVVWMVPLGSPENFDINHHAVVHVSGVPTNIDKHDSTFEIHADQYLSATKNADNVFPVRCGFPDTPRWKKYKPVPGKGKPVSIEGFLTGVERNEDKTVKYFIVDLEKVTFHGQAPAAPKAEESPTKLVNNGTPARLKFTGFFGSQGTDENSEEPATKKRKTADDRAIRESQDKGEGTSTGRRATNTRR